MLNNRDLRPHPFALMHFACKVSKRTFSNNILLPKFSFPLKIFILHSTNRKVDGLQMERTLNEIGAGQADAQTR